MPDDLPTEPLELLALIEQDVHVMRRASRGGTQTLPAAVARNAAAVGEVAEHWVPVAAALRDSTASPTHRAHWDQLIDTTDLTQPVHTFEAVMLRARDLLQLLHALKDALTYQRSVHDVATAIAADISSGTWTPDAWLVLADLADEFDVPKEWVRFALADLVTDGLVTVKANGAHKVGGDDDR
ncbi:GntR family transcriptional regulator [Actinacidiphila sp. bgisy144]|uniref:GntR family transcriptional regulator n=1 Tax=Actinacidiphila sp. bgisy144 TaxID=3413791 RepID=UPI003EB928A4